MKLFLVRFGQHQYVREIRTRVERGRSVNPSIASRDGPWTRHAEPGKLPAGLAPASGHRPAGQGWGCHEVHSARTPTVQAGGPSAIGLEATLVRSPALGGRCGPCGGRGCVSHGPWSPAEATPISSACHLRPQPLALPVGDAPNPDGQQVPLGTARWVLGDLVSHTTWGDWPEPDHRAEVTLSGCCQQPGAGDGSCAQSGRVRAA